MIIKGKKFIAGLFVFLSAVFVYQSFHGSPSAKNGATTGSGSESLAGGNIAAQVLSKKLYAEGLHLFQFKQLSDAVMKWELSVSLWEENRSARVKLETAERLLKELVESGYKNGLVDFHALHFERAIEEWNSVLSLIKDPHDPRREQLEQGIKSATERLKESAL